jgi:Acetyltransferases
MIRAATSTDLRRIVEMSEQFYAKTKYHHFAEFDPLSVAVLAETLIDYGVLLLYELDGNVVGMVGLVLTPFLFNSSRIGAYEIVWWVEPEAQGLGVGRDLLEAVEPACREKSADLALIQMVHLNNSPPQAARMYEHLGYQHSESSYTKVM